MADIKNLNNDSVRFEDGSASAPSISFIGDTNTGIYRLSGDSGRFYFTADGTAAVRIDGNGLALQNKTLYIQSGRKVNFDYGVSNNYYIIKDSTTLNMHSPVNLSLQTNSSHRLYINQSGNVGVGTTSPTSKLHLYTGTNVITPLLTLHNSTATNGSTAGLSIDFVASSDAGAVGSRIIGTRVEDGAHMDLRFHTRRDDFAMIIDEDQNVGIGTTSPAEKLDVVGTARMDTGVTEGVHYVGTGLQHWGDGGTGMNFPSNDNIDLLTSSTSRVRVDSSGNVGIGTTSPGAKLHVDGNWRLDGISGGYFENYSFGSQLNISEITTGGWARANRIVTSDSSGYVFFGVLGSGTTTSRAYWTIGDPAVINTTGYDSANGVVLLKNGNVGIGKTSPSARLEVAASATTSIDIAHFSNSNGSAKTKLSLDSVGSSYLSMLDASNNEDIRLSAQSQSWFNAGNVGIGTTSPAEKLEVSGSAKIGNLKIHNANGGRIGLNRNTSTGAIYNSSYGAFQIQNNGSDLFEIQSYTSAGTYSGVISMKAADGKVGIGTTSPAEKIHVAGNIRATGWIGGDSSNYITFDETNGRIDFYAGGNFVARLESDGDLHVKGDVIAFSSIFA